MRAAGAAGVAVAAVAAVDAVVMPVVDAFGHLLRQFPEPPDWRAAVAVTLAGRSWFGEAVHLIAGHPAWWEAAQVPWAAAALLAAYSAAWAARRAGEPRPAGTATHGSARWRRSGELRRTLRLVDCGSPEAAGVVVGSDGRWAWVTRPEGGNPHVLVLGTPGSGKSRGVVLPTIWVLGHAGDSLVVSDPKGELYGHAAPWLSSRGYEVHLVDLVEPARGGRWNPLEPVRRAIRAGAVAEAAARAWELAHTFAFGLARPTGEGLFWAQASEALLAALALGVAAEAPEGGAHPASMLRILLELGSGGGALLDGWFRMLGPGHPAAVAYGGARVAAGSEKTQASIYTTAATHLRLFGDPGIAWLTSASDHDPVRLGVGERPVAVFLCVPDESEARHALVSLYVSQAYAALVGAARELPGGALPRPVWFLLDEFGNIGRLADVRSKVTAARSRRIRFVFAVQNLEQLAGLYGADDAATVVGNCDTLVYLSTNSNQTAKTISERIGSYTVKTVSVSTKPGSVVGATEAATGRPLMAPDEVMRLAPGQALVLQARQHAARLPLADLSRWREAARALEPRGLPEPRRVEPAAGWVPDAEAILRELAREAAAQRDAAQRALAEAGLSEGGAPPSEPEAPRLRWRGRGSSRV